MKNSNLVVSVFLLLLWSCAKEPLAPAEAESTLRMKSLFSDEVQSRIRQALKPNKIQGEASAQLSQRRVNLAVAFQGASDLYWDEDELKEVNGDLHVALKDVRQEFRSLRLAYERGLEGNTRRKRYIRRMDSLLRTNPELIHFKVEVQRIQVESWGYPEDPPAGPDKEKELSDFIIDGFNTVFEDQGMPNGFWKLDYSAEFELTLSDVFWMDLALNYSQEFNPKRRLVPALDKALWTRLKE